MRTTERDLTMRRLFVVFVLLLVGIAGLGFYQGWFHLSSENGDQKSSVTFSVDENKIQKDEEKAKEKMKDLGQTVKDKTGSRTDKVEEPERRP
jgi:predicted negative regulator of RcsB-dependent stress response